MIFDLVRPAQPQSIRWLALQEFVDKVSGFHGPAVGNVGFLQVDLFRKNLVSDVLASFTCVGPPSEHEFVGDHSEGKVVDLHTMVLATHHFGSHVTGRARRVMRIVRRPNPRNAHVSDPHVAVALEQQILRLDVPVDHAVAVHVLEADDDAGDKKLGLLLREPLLFVVVVSQIAASHQICHQVNVLEVHEGVEHIDQESSNEKRRKLGEEARESGLAGDCRTFSGGNMAKTYGCLS